MLINGGDNIVNSHLITRCDDRAIIHIWAISQLLLETFDVCDVSSCTNK